MQKTALIILIAALGGVLTLFYSIWVSQSQDFIMTSRDDMSDEYMIKLADDFEETEAFKKKYPQYKTMVDRSSDYGVHYSAYPDEPFFQDFSGEKISSYVKLYIRFSSPSSYGPSYVYCIPNYDRTEKFYQDDWLKHYKVKPEENIVDYLHKGGCFNSIEE